MVAACHRRTGNHQQAYRCYSSTLDQFPDSEECVRHLIRLAAEMRLPKQYAELSERLQRLQRNREMREKRSQSAKRSSAMRKSAGKPVNQSSLEANTCNDDIVHLTGSREDSASSNSSSGQFTARTNAINDRPSGRPDSCSLQGSRSSDEPATADDLDFNGHQRSTTGDIPFNERLQQRPRTSQKRPSDQDDDDLANEDLFSILPTCN